jgi:hypothetical protein
VRAGCACRLAVAQTNAAITHWAVRSCRRVLSHWCFYAQQARQLGVHLPSSPSSCSNAEQPDQLQHNQRQAAPAGRCSGIANCASRSSAVVGYAGRDDLHSSGAEQLARSWSSRSSALKQQLQAAQRSKSLSLSVELPNSQQQQLATSPAAAAAAAIEAAISSLSPKPSGQQGSLRSLSARLSPVLSRSSTQQQQQRRPSAAAAGADSSSSCSDSEVSALLAPAANSGSRLSASDAAVAAAWADVAGAKRASRQPTRQSSRSMVTEAEAAASATLSPRIIQQQQHSPRLSSWGTTEAANTPDAAAAAAALPSSTRVSWQQQARGSLRSSCPSAAAAASDVTDAAALLRRASRQSAASSPRSAAWFDQVAADSTRHSMQQQQAGATSRRSRHHQVSLSTGSLQDALSRQHSLSLGPAAKGHAAVAAGGTAAGSSSLVLPIVPVEVQRSFVGAARAQKLRRRWLLVKAWNRWQQLLQVRRNY